MGFLEFVGLIIGSGLLSGVVLHFLQKHNTDAIAGATVDKTAIESKQIAQELESKYIEQLKKWIDDLNQIKDKHEKTLADKNKELDDLHKKSLDCMQELAEREVLCQQVTNAVRRVMSSGDVAYYETDPTGALAYVNGAWLRLFGLTMAEVKNNDWVKSIPEDDRDNMVNAWDAIAADQREGNMTFKLLNPVTHETYEVKSSFAIVRDEQDNVVKIIGVTYKTSA